jgi:hypothetical protein
MADPAAAAAAGPPLPGPASPHYGDLPPASKAVPYLELFNNSPLLALRLGDPGALSSQLSAAELVQWVFHLQPVLDGLADKYGMHKVHPHDSGATYLFCLNPQLPPAVQAPTMLQLAWDLKHRLLQVGAGPRARAALSVSLPGCLLPCCWRCTSGVCAPAGCNRRPLRPRRPPPPSLAAAGPAGRRVARRRPPRQLGHRPALRRLRRRGGRLGVVDVRVSGDGQRQGAKASCPPPAAACGT